MAKINVLDSSIYNLIAAGEVVERPASVVKELVENSIDAGSTHIKVEILDGGIKEIRVTDNGSGIEKEYLVNAFLPHATSKISKASDLESIFTLGFRGEALASIAAVSNVRLTSKVQDEELGNTIVLSAGNIISNSTVGATNGTTIVVSDLFFNVPARAKFLKKAKTEEQEITNLIERFVLANPQLNFTYVADGKTVLQSQGGTLKEALYAVYGKQAISETLEVFAEKEGIKVSGYIGRPSFSKPNRTYQTIVINGRYVQNTTISTAVTNAYGEMLMKRRYPFFVLSLQIDPTTVDVNVHPNKTEVRFENSGRIFSICYEAVSRALSEMDYILEVDTQTGEVLKHQGGIKIAPKVEVANTEIKTPTVSLQSTLATKSGTKIDKMNVSVPSVLSVEQPTVFQSETQEEKKKEEIISAAAYLSSAQTKAADGFGLGSKLLEKLAANKSEQQSFVSQEFNNAAIKTIGKLFKTYVLVEYGNNLYMIDQHAAHERILYEKFKREVDSKQLIVQPLMFPYILPVNGIEYNMIEQCLDQIRELGFDIEDFGDKTYKISSVPMLLANINIENFFASFLGDMQGTVSKQSDIIKEKLMQHSCKSAIKAGNDLSQNEIEQLFSQMNDEKIPLFCPHGRPIAVRITKAEIEKWFKRIV